jgi:hypothetical protein
MAHSSTRSPFLAVLLKLVGYLYVKSDLVGIHHQAVAKARILVPESSTLQTSGRALYTGVKIKV